MTGRPKISEAELQVMQVLWDDPPLGAAEVAARIESRGWSLATVKSLLSRLMAKGAVTADRQGRRFLYRPAIERAPVAASQASRLVDRLFGGRVSPLVAQLAESGQIDERDLDELEALVARLKS